MDLDTSSLYNNNNAEKPRSSKRCFYIFLCSVRLTGAWEDRINLAKLKEKIVTEDGRVILRIENEAWKVPPENLNSIFPSVYLITEFDRCGFSGSSCSPGPALSDSGVAASPNRTSEDPTLHR